MVCTCLLSNVFVAEAGPHDSAKDGRSANTVSGKFVGVPVGLQRQAPYSTGAVYWRTRSHFSHSAEIGGVPQIQFQQGINVLVAMQREVQQKEIRSASRRPCSTCDGDFIKGSQTSEVPQRRFLHKIVESQSLCSQCQGHPQSEFDLPCHQRDCFRLCI